MKLDITSETLVDVIAEVLLDGLRRDAIVPGTVNGSPVNANLAIADVRIQWARERARNAAQRLVDFEIETPGA